MKMSYMLLPSSGFETKETLKELFKVDAYLQDYFAFPSPPKLSFAQWRYSNQ